MITELMKNALCPPSPAHTQLLRLPRPVLRQSALLSWIALGALITLCPKSAPQNTDSSSTRGPYTHPQIPNQYCGLGDSSQWRQFPSARGAVSQHHNHMDSTHAHSLLVSRQAERGPYGYQVPWPYLPNPSLAPTSIHPSALHPWRRLPEPQGASDLLLVIRAPAWQNPVYHYRDQRNGRSLVWWKEGCNWAPKSFCVRVFES